ncbi:hypothetical protein [Shimia sediminis]|uniref:hypothetical protein n=1 Tax=Shimia sediminis TaxID=2497945 RepID=UPI000F8E2A9F|nr:hypothetical protein [Shimia sediminis]
MTNLIRAILVMTVAAVLAGCVKHEDYAPSDVARLSQAIQALGPNVDPAEADRAAALSYAYARELANGYNVTDPPIIHNAKVHSGKRERGLCNHYAEDMLRRLYKENYQTLDLHWVTSPPTEFRIIHHTAAISRKGAGPMEAIVLDGWRKSGHLTWATVAEDTRYNWRPRMEVREELLAKQAEKEARKAQ